MKRVSKYVIAAMLFGVVLAGCKSFTKGYDSNPDASTSGASASYLFPGAQASFDLFQEGFPSMLSALWAQQATGAASQFTGYYNYTITSQDFQNDWPIAYDNVLYNLRATEKVANAAGESNLEGAAKIVEGTLMGTVADLWGDVPYSQAAQPSVYLHPKYDKQDSVYTQVQAVLDAGIAEITSDNNPLSADIFSSAGDQHIWLAAAHTAKARFLMHAARHDNYTPSEMQAVIAQCQAGILATDGSQDMMFTHAQGVYNGDMNIWCSFIDYDRGGYMDASETFIIPMMQAASLDGKTNYTGQLDYYFIPADGAFNDGAHGAFSETSPYPIFRASETHLLWAEAAARSGDDVTALAQLNLARVYNNNVFGDSSAAYVATDPQVSTPASLLQTIINTEYISLMSQIEAFNLVRRVGYNIQYTDSTGAVHKMAPIHGSQFPQRFFYPINEVNTNPNMPTQPSLFTPTWANGGQ